MTTQERNTYSFIIRQEFMISFIIDKYYKLSKNIESPKYLDIEDLKYFLSNKLNYNKILNTICKNKNFNFLKISKIKIANWILKMKPNINISEKNEFAFCWTCANENLKIAKWII